MQPCLPKASTIGLVEEADLRFLDVRHVARSTKPPKLWSTTSFGQCATCSKKYKTTQGFCQRMQDRVFGPTFKAERQYLRFHYGLGEKIYEFEYRVPDQHLDSWELKPVNMESAAGDPDFKNRFLPCKRYSIKKKTVCSLWCTVRVGARSGGIGSMVPPAV